MTSIHTNMAAIAALHALRSVGNSLQQTQAQVSTGLRIQTASDNSAYWSIATTMRSDTGSNSAIQDALGLNAAKLDVAYSGTDYIVDIISKFKARLVAARDEGVDRQKIQQELAQFNRQAENVVNSSSFSGVNWLRSHEPIHFMDGPEFKTTLVASHDRSDTGAVSIGRVSVDLKKIAMLNEGGGGILQKEVGAIGDIGGFRDSRLVASAHNGHEAHVFTGPATFTGADFIEFSAVVDAIDHTPLGPLDPGVTYAGIRIDKSVIDAALGTTDGVINTAAEMRKVLQMAFDNAGVPAWTAVPNGFTSFGDMGMVEFGSMEALPNAGSSIFLSGFNSSFGGVVSNYALGLEDPPPPGREHHNMLPKASVSFTQPFEITGRATLTFDVQIDNAPAQPITVTRTTINNALGTFDGKVTDVDDFAAVMNLAVAGSGLIATSSDPDFPGVLTFRADPMIYPEAGNKAVHFSITNVKTDPPSYLRFGLAEVDVTTNEYTIDEYIDGVDYMLQKAISSASMLGALRTRIDMLSSFTTKLADSFDSGIGRLVDAEMSEASTRLKALQTQQQLALQSLQIANSNPENIMQLFR